MTPQALADLHAACFAHERAWTAAEFAELLQSQAVFLVPSQDGASGFALGRVAAEEAELLTLAVAPDARRQGRGRTILQRFASEAQERGARDAFLEVAADNAAAIALYTNGGYVERARRPGYYARAGGSRVDALVLGRALG